MKIGGGLLLVLYLIVREFLIEYIDLEGFMVIVGMLGLFVILINYDLNDYIFFCVDIFFIVIIYFLCN